MPDENTEALYGKRAFEERVFVRFDALDSAMRTTDLRLQKLEKRAYQTKPIWEEALKEIVETRRELSKRLIVSRLSPMRLGPICETLKIGLNKIETKP